MSSKQLEKNQYCNKCGRGFSDCKKGNAQRLDPSRYMNTPQSADQYCTACYYQHNSGYSRGGSDY